MQKMLDGDVSMNTDSTKLEKKRQELAAIVNNSQKRIHASGSEDSTIPLIPSQTGTGSFFNNNSSTNITTPRLVQTLNESELKLNKNLSGDINSINNISNDQKEKSSTALYRVKKVKPSSKVGTSEYFSGTTNKFNGSVKPNNQPLKHHCSKHSAKTMQSAL